MKSFVVLGVLGVLCVAPAVGFSQSWFTDPPKAYEDMAMLKRVRKVSAEARLDAKLRQALDLLATTETGRDLAYLVSSGRIKLDTSAEAGPLYEDGTSRVSYPRDFIRDGEVWQQAVILAHELEHARQDLRGLHALNARGARETAAFLVQSKVWVELGGKVRASDLPANGWNSHDMIAWLEYPMSAVAALSVRGGMPVELGDRGVSAYWHETLLTEEAWRKRWKPRFPRFDSKASAEFILGQAAGLGVGSCRYK